MVAILGPFEPNAGRNFARKSSTSDGLRDYAQNVRLEGGLRILGGFGRIRYLWAHHARLSLHLSILRLSAGYPYAHASLG